MDPGWESQFRRRMRAFELGRTTGDDGGARLDQGSRDFGMLPPRALASGVRPHRRAAPLDAAGTTFAFEEHESGPELLVLLALATSGLGLAKSVVDLIITIIKARQEGIARGDTPSDPVELIVRRMDGELFREEIVLRIGHREGVDRAEIKTLFKDAIERLAADKPSDR